MITKKKKLLAEQQPTISTSDNLLLNQQSFLWLIGQSPLISRSDQVPNERSTAVFHLNYLQTPQNVSPFLLRQYTNLS